MATINCKIPEELNNQLEAEAARTKVPKSALVRKALKRSLPLPKKKLQKSAFQSVKDLCGLIQNGPKDVSTNPKYLKDFGR